MRSRPYRPLFCLPEIFFQAGHRSDRQASRCGSAARCDSYVGGGCFSRFSRHARDNIWRRSARLRDRARIPRNRRERKAPRKHPRAGARISPALRTHSRDYAATGLRIGFRQDRGISARRPCRDKVKNMTTTTLVAPISLSNDLLTGAEWSPAHTRDLLQLSADVKARPGRYASTLSGKFIALIFEKPSLRTRVTFEVGIQSMGGSVVFLDHTQASASLGARESIADVARNLERWVQGIVARVYHQRVLEEMAANANIPVINALSDKFHPCQALADFFTLEEKFGALRGFKLTYVGDGNNVCHSLIYLAARLGVHLRVATPAEYAPLPEVVADGKRVARETKAKIELMTDPREAVSGAMGVYTDSWTSMGFEAEGQVRNSVFRPYQVNTELMSLAAPDAVFMHCLPAHRGLEVTPEILDGPQSVVLDQSENRMYVQKAILHTLF